VSFALPTKQLSDIATKIDYGVTASASTIDTGTKFLRITDIQDGSVEWPSVPFCEAPGDKLRSARLDDGDIVFARTGATTGKSFLIKSPPDGAVFASYLIRVKPSPSIDAGYLAHFFQSSGYWNQIKKKTQGAAQGGVNATSLSELEIPFPRLDEQRRIASILDKADALRRKRRRALELLDSLPQAIFLEMFGDLTRRERFKAMRLVDCCISSDDIRCGPFGTQLYQSDFQNSGIPLWGIKHVNAQFSTPTVEFLSPAKAENLKNYALLPDDLVMTRKGTIGNVAVYPHDGRNGIMHSDLLRVRLNAKIVTAPFMAAQLKFDPAITHQISLISGGAIMAGINVGKLKSIRVFVPPIDLQQKFVSLTGTATALKAKQSRDLDLQEANFMSLQHGAFSGQL
jgi:type I restriction enzyme S subunit